MLAASKLPALSNSLGDFAHAFRIEGQLREGRQALDRITKSLADNYDSEIKLLTNGQGIAFVKTEDARLLRERRENLAFQQEILKRISDAIQEEKPAKEIDILRSQASSLLSNMDALSLRLREVSPRDASLDSHVIQA